MALLDDDIDFFLPLAAAPKRKLEAFAMEPDFCAFPYQFALAFGADGSDQLELRVFEDANVPKTKLALEAGHWRVALTAAAHESNTTARLTKTFRSLAAITGQLFEEGHFHEAKEYLDVKWKANMKK